MPEINDPRRLLEPARRFLSREECERLAQRAGAFATGGGETSIGIDTWWSGELRWGRNRVTLSSDRRTNDLRIARRIHGASASVRTNQIDDVSIRSAVLAAERALAYRPTSPEEIVEPPASFEYLSPVIWSDRTFDLTAAERVAAARAIIEPASAAGLLSAGYIEVRGAGRAVILPSAPPLYAPYTEAQCSLTVRDPKGMGSGWAGLSSYDWGRIDTAALAARALQKCLASRNPVAIEPGRYTVILEPQATHDLIRHIVMSFDSRTFAEGGAHPFARGQGFSKLGIKVVDERITIDHDPMHPDLGVVPFMPSGEPVRPVTWIAHGVLMRLAYDREYALTRLHENLGYPNTVAYRMSGGETSIGEMIATTRRGLLVTRFSNIRIIDGASLLLTGVTRDGLWLVENGKISKPVKNLRFTESPLFVLNSVEQLGPPERVFSPGAPAIVPPLKVRDFSFTATIDAI
jgi:predicted Zn-dependent protease